MLRARDHVPHFTITALDGSPVVYTRIWQRRHLVLLCLPPGDAASHQYVEEVRAALETLSAIPSEDPQDSMKSEQLRRLVQAILDHLPTRYGDVLEWKYIQGLSVKEIATRLGVAPKAAESVLSRARVAFRDGFAAVGAPQLLESTIGGRDE